MVNIVPVAVSGPDGEPVIVQVNQRELRADVLLTRDAQGVLTVQHPETPTGRQFVSRLLDQSRSATSALIAQ